MSSFVCSVYSCMYVVVYYIVASARGLVRVSCLRCTILYPLFPCMLDVHMSMHVISSYVFFAFSVPTLLLKMGIALSLRHRLLLSVHKCLLPQPTCYDVLRPAPCRLCLPWASLVALCYGSNRTGKEPLFLSSWGVSNAAEAVMPLQCRLHRRCVPSLILCFLSQRLATVVE